MGLRVTGRDAGRLFGPSARGKGRKKERKTIDAALAHVGVCNDV